jgi:hypothetical protein
MGVLEEYLKRTDEVVLKSYAESLLMVSMECVSFILGFQGTGLE